VFVLVFCKKTERTHLLLEAIAKLPKLRADLRNSLNFASFQSGQLSFAITSLEMEIE
jgi:hypothetical protein